MTASADRRVVQVNQGRGHPPARSLLPHIERHDRNLADQLKRAASSVVLNLAEGRRLTKANKANNYAIAHGSANEVRAALPTAVAWGWIDDASEQLAILDRLLALLWRLNHPKRA